MIKVVYPHGGRKFILNWYTYMERNHIIIADSLQGLNDAAIKVFRRHPNAEIKQAFEIDVVAPSDLLNKITEEKVRKNDVFHFHGEVCDRLKTAAEKGYTIPYPFKICNFYEPENYRDVENDWMKTNHIDCKQCTYKIHCELTAEELFERYYDAWREKNPTRFKQDSKYITSRAPKANDNDLLWAAVPNFGPHAGGIDIEKVNLDINDSYYNEHCLFLFKRIQDIDTTQLEKTLTDMVEKLRRSRKNYETTQSKKRKEEEIKRIEDAIGVFNVK